MVRIIKDEKGSALPFLILFVAVFIILAGICIEWHHTVSLRNYIEKELTRALRISIEASMLDEYRRDHISRIDSYTARTVLHDYLKNTMNLDSTNAKIVNGNLVYILNFDEINLVEEPPSITVKGTIEKSPLLFDIKQNISIPFVIKVKNTRLEMS